ncbi:MAG: DUF6049 family protein [Jatrophihabitantaceae bacterium]
MSGPAKSLHPHHRSRRILATAAVVLLALVLTGWLPAAAAQPGPNSVTVTVLQVTPSTPIASAKPRTIQVELQLTNTTAEDLGTLRVDGARGNPISNQTALDAAIAKPQPPDPGLVGSFTAKTPVTTALAPGESTTLTYASTTASNDAAGLCLCETRIYPLYFSVHQESAGGQLVGSTQTYLPSFTSGAHPQKVRVSWVWPILERPHRSAYDNVFTDDDLATSVAAGGRLDRLLQVVEQVSGAQVPMTVLTDPDLLDELAVMAAGKYTVRSGTGPATPGTGSSDAKTWLQRLRTALDGDPGLQLSFTPYADPDVDSLVRNGLSWSTQQSAPARQRVSVAIGGRSVPTDLAWPVGSALSQQTLDALARTGTSTVIVDDTTLPGGRHDSPLPDALASLPTQYGRVTAAVTSTAIEHYADQVVSQGGDGLARLPELVAEVAVRAVEDGANAHYVLITPPRDVDPDPSVAVAAITATARTIWSRPLALGPATRTVKPVDHGELASERSAKSLPDDIISAAQFVLDSVPGLISMIPASSQRQQLVGSLRNGVQRSESSEWTADPTTGGARAHALRASVTAVTGAVHLVKPTTGTYTLGSADSPLPITIANTLAVPVSVRVQVSTVGGLPGFRADDVGVQTLAPRSRLPLHIPVHVDRAGRIKVQVNLTAPDGAPLGILPLSLRSTALGDIGKVITFVAAAVLAIALLVRIALRWRRRENGSTR